MKKLVLLSTSLLFLISILAGCEATLPDNIEAIEVEQKSVLIEVGDKESLKIKLKPEKVINNDLILTSDNESVATVNGVGEVTGIAVGKAEITIKAEKGAAQVKLPVTVVEKGAIPVSLTDNDMDIVKGENGEFRIILKSNDNTKKIKENTVLSFSTDNTLSSLKIEKRATEILQVAELCFDSSYLTYSVGNGQRFAMDIKQNKAVSVEIKSSFNLAKRTIITAE